MNGVAANWYPDPQGQHELRYFDGRAWTSHVATAGQTFNEAVPSRIPPPVQNYGQQQQYPVQHYGQQNYGQQQYGFAPVQPYPAYYVKPRQSVWVAFILTFFFGPLGMFYSTIPGASVMLAITLFFAVFTFGLSLVITWPICIIWGMAACD